MSTQVRQVIVDGPNRFVNNRVRTTKYTPLTFLPYFIHDQFSKPANVFFLVISSLQQIESLSPTGRWGTLIPFCIVITVSAIKEIYEDWNRRTADLEVNERKALVYNNGQFVACEWQKLLVGNIVKVVRDEHFPADLVLLGSSDENGFCYIETSHLDGETNLKSKQARSSTKDLKSLASCVLSCAAPNDKINDFEGSLEMSVERISLSKDQFLPRGAALRNTEWILGVIVYTGHETKIFMNSKQTPRKFTKMDKVSDHQMVYIVALLLIIVITCLSGFLLHSWSTLSKLQSYQFVWTVFASSVTFLLLFNNLVPISLAISLESVRVILARLIDNDSEMYDPETNQTAKAKSSNLLEELGQVQFILTDKTGTLTCNQMTLKHMIIQGREFRNCTRNGSSLCSALESPTASIQMFMENLLTCHSVMVDRNRVQKQEIQYQASSPDELGIIEAASLLDVILTDNSARKITVDWRGEHVCYEILACIEFTSERKMMSVLVKRPDGRCILYAKGADSVICSKLKSSNEENTITSLEILQKHAVEGLRTLCMAHREIHAAEVEQWIPTWTAATNAVIDRQAALDEAAAFIERDLEFAGAVAIEDKLQDGVPEAVETLIKANIRIWMLTGDRSETAINTSYLSRLITAETVILDLLADADSDEMDLLRRAQDKYESTKLARHAILINGRAFEQILESKSTESQKLFHELAENVPTLVACRLSPIQKSQITEMVKVRFNKIVLAIGDGGNDVGMIQTANVGVGIAGLEGLQASRSSDFSIAKFRFLVRLLLVHGSWSLHRLSRVVHYTIYKNLTVFLCQFWYAWMNQFSGQSFCSSKLLMCYNLVFTSAPPVILGLTEQYVPAKQLTSHPQLYTFGQRGKFYDDRAFLTCILGAIFTSFLICTLYYFLMSDGVLFHDGFTFDWNFQGSLLYLLILLTVSVKILFFTNFITRPMLISVAASIGAWFIFFLLESSNAHLFTAAFVWGCMILVPVVGCSRDFLWKYYRRVFKPRPYHIIQEMEAIERKERRKLGKKSLSTASDTGLLNK